LGLPPKSPYLGVDENFSATILSAGIPASVNLAVMPARNVWFDFKHASKELFSVFMEISTIALSAWTSTFDSPVKVIDFGKLRRYAVSSEGVPLSSGSANAVEAITNTTTHTIIRFRIAISPFYNKYAQEGVFTQYFTQIRYSLGKIKSRVFTCCVFAVIVYAGLVFIGTIKG